MLELSKRPFFRPPVSVMKRPCAGMPIAWCKHESRLSKIDNAFLRIIGRFTKHSDALGRQVLRVDAKVATETPKGQWHFKSFLGEEAKSKV